MSSTRLIIPYFQFSDDTKLNDKKRKEALASVQMIDYVRPVSEYISPLDWLYQTLGEHASLEWRFGKPLLSEDERVLMDTSCDYHEEKLSPDERFTRGLARLSQLFLAYHLDLRKIPNQTTPACHLKRVKALTTLENGVHEFLGNLSTYLNYAGTLSDNLIEAFNNAVASEKKYIASRLDNLIPVEEGEYVELQDKLKRIHMVSNDIFEEIRATRFSVNHLIAAAEVKEQLKNKPLPATFTLLEKQLTGLPDILSNFYNHVVMFNDFATIHKAIELLQKKLYALASTFDRLQSSQRPSETFSNALLRAIAAEQVFLRDLILHGNYETDVQMLLSETRNLCATLFNNILEHTQLLDLLPMVEVQANYVRSDYRVYAYTTGLLRGKAGLTEDVQRIGDSYTLSK